MKSPDCPVSHSELLQLRRWNTPTIYNGWEQITALDAAAPVTNLEPTTDYMPQMGAMVGWAVTLVVEPSQASHRQAKSAWADYREYIASVAGPKIVVVQDLDKPKVIGSFWGEVTANTHRALNCVGTIVDGAIRDVDEMTYAGFKALARRLCVGHAHSVPVRWGCEVEVFGTQVRPGQLLHADKHGFIAIPLGEERQLLSAAIAMDVNECETVISAARSCAGQDTEELLAEVIRASIEFSARAKKLFGRHGEH
jgi:4-hydroxy-4-methyl-2-oxoglutarate aldolase